ncbi:hypothetical protein [Hwangdonia lutea]|uniref:Uncharacterized protein n=1 Tax=Hwangdonia lutea TaxID=3075823 RepID=A0AA97HQQ2_9FLAO|nr:hypothetical protein [Hwangdonia sp. SCSIO 19198]WOD44191.1 hypothetical protein RNZ46_02755 [Hwangdonia sp. SCSIO 19198]
MSFFSSLLHKRNIPKHHGRPLWKYLLTNEEFQRLSFTLQFGNIDTIDPRDVTLYYAQWWKENYNGGIPSKQDIFDSLGGNIRFNLTYDEFYKLARMGAQILGIKWIKKQNTLYFKTLLLQGGLPLKHISENHGNYKAFLEAVLEEQPETIEDFMFKTHIIDLLPKSSQNDIIYENCLEIVKSILNNDGEYDKLLESEDSLKDISSALKVKSASLTKKIKQSKTKNYWLLSFKNNECNIFLRLGLANTYTKDTLSDILGFEALERDYQFFMDDNLVCVFRKMANGQFKTDWYNQENKEWDLSTGLPYTYVICNEKKTELPDYIQTIPNLEEPSLWARFNDKEWRLIKGYAASNKEAAVLFPTHWKCDLPSSLISLYTKSFFWMPFEGEVDIQFEEEIKTYMSGVSSFDWIIENKKPIWMLKSNLPVVQGIPNILVYDDEGYDIKRNRFKVWIKKHNSKDIWENLSRLSYISTGCFDLRIEKDDLIAHDVFFNIGNLQARYSNQSIHSALIEFRNLDYFECKLNESTLVQIEEDNNRYVLKVNTELSKIPTIIKGSLGFPSKKKLFFDLLSPFQGMAIIDKDGQIINEDQPLSLANLYGMRILSTPNTETLLKIKNSLKTDVKIIKEIKESNQPVISFKDEIVRLFYLADAMDFKNTVCLELSEGKHKKIYKISGFSHMLDIDNQLRNKVSLLNSNDNLELFAIPVNCTADEIEIISLVRNDESYVIPSTDISNQFIIISSKKEGKQLMPRFVNTGDFFLGVDKYERIENYHKELTITTYNDDVWQQVLAYFKICVQYDLPFSTFDQLRAISRGSEVASRAFLFLGINQSDSTEYIQKAIPEMEKDLGFCFHWITKTDWGNAIAEINEPDNYKYYSHIAELISSYMGENGLQKLFKFISGSNIESEPILQRNILDLRSQLGTRVLGELPYNSPKINGNYNIQVEEHHQVRLLLQAPIAVAESISDRQKDYPIWAGDEKREVIRRNIQYSQYLKPDFYNKTIFHALKRC